MIHYPISISELKYQYKLDITKAWNRYKVDVETIKFQTFLNLLKKDPSTRLYEAEL